jgi:hypothetical protein
VYSRRIVDGTSRRTLKADILPLQALRHERFDAGGDPTGLTHHPITAPNPHGQRPATDRSWNPGAILSTGTVGDSTIMRWPRAISAFKTELIRARAVGTVEQVELATLEWVR